MILFQLEVLNNWNDKSIIMLLLVLNEMFPEGETLLHTTIQKRKEKKIL